MNILEYKIAFFFIHPVYFVNIYGNGGPYDLVASACPAQLCLGEFPICFQLVQIQPSATACKTLPTLDNITLTPIFSGIRVGVSFFIVYFFHVLLHGHLCSYLNSPVTYLSRSLKIKMDVL